MALRNTIQRSLVFEAVNALHSHPTADEIFDEVSRVHPAISRATVYRNLNVLAEEGKIRRLPIPDGADRYDHVPEPHYHVRCEACSRVFDVDMELLQDVISRIRDSRGFRFLGHDIIFKGVCPECLARERGEHPELARVL